MVWCLADPACAQTAAAPTPQAPAAKSTAKKSAAKATKPAVAPIANSGSCKFGVITAAEDIFTVQRIMTIVNNSYAEVPVNWGFDDLIFARVRAAAGGIPLRRLSYPKGAFESYYHPKPSLFGHREELAALVRQIAGNAGCESYMLITRATIELQGTHQQVTGFGVLSQGFLKLTFVYAYFNVTVFDGHTFEIRPAPSRSLKSVFAHMAANVTTNEDLHEIDKTAYPESPPDAANSATLRDATRAFLTERLDKTLPAYFRTGEQ